MRLVMLGGTGSGKGTQTAKLSDRLKVPSISTGDILRAGIASKTELGQQAETYVAQGELVPDDLMIRLIQQRLQQPDMSKGCGSWKAILERHFKLKNWTSCSKKSSKN